MQQNLEYKDLIELSIRNSAHYKNNEDLFEDFYNESYKKLQKNIAILGNKLPPKNYIDKVINTTILKVLKETGRLKRKNETENDLPISNLISYNIDEYGEVSFNIPYPYSQREKKELIYEQLKYLTENLEKMNENEPEKHFIKLFELKYEKKLRMPEIALELNIPEEIAVSRYFELLSKLNSYY